MPAETAPFGVLGRFSPGVVRTGRFSFVAVEGPAGLAVVDSVTGVVVADYPYPSEPGGTRAHGVYYVPRVLR